MLRSSTAVDVHDSSRGQERGQTGMSGPAPAWTTEHLLQTHSEMLQGWRGGSALGTQAGQLTRPPPGAASEGTALTHAYNHTDTDAELKINL